MNLIADVTRLNKKGSFWEGTLGREVDRRRDSFPGGDDNKLSRKKSFKKTIDDSKKLSKKRNLSDSIGNKKLSRKGSFTDIDINKLGRRKSFGTIDDAKKLVKMGNKKISKRQLTGDKYNEALTYFRQAANIYRYYGEWEGCAETLVKYNEFSENDKLSIYREIANCYRRFDKNKYIEWLLKIIQVADLENNFEIMTHTYHKLAELHETDDPKNSLKYYEQVIYLQKTGNFISDIHNIKLKMAELYIQLNGYTEAIKILQDVLIYYSNGNVLIEHINNILLSIVLSYLCIRDEGSAGRSINHFHDNYCNFSSSRHYELIHNTMVALEINDYKYVDEIIKKFDGILDNINLLLLNKIKQLIAQDVD